MLKYSAKQGTMVRAAARKYPSAASMLDATHGQRQTQMGSVVVPAAKSVRTRRTSTASSFINSCVTSSFNRAHTCFAVAGPLAASK
jgi:hypothetical protein